MPQGAAPAISPSISPSIGPGIVLVALHAGWSHSSLALASLTAFCRDEPFFDRIHRIEALEKGEPHWLLEEILALQPALVGFSTYLWNIHASLRLARLIKRLSPGTTLVFGGPEAGPRALELLAAEADLDFVIAGEGEGPFRELLRHRLYGESAPEQIAGLAWRASDGTPRQNPIALLPMEALVSPFELGLVAFDRPLVYWETSRGCPFRCTFCGSAEERLRLVPESRIERELALIARHPPRTVKLLDRSFHLGKGRTLRLLERFLDTPEGLRFHLELNPDRISPEAIKLFHAAPAGKFQFEIGLQTLDDGVLGRIERAMDIPQALDNIRRLVALRKHPVHLDLIVGLPGQDAAGCRADLDRTFRLDAGHLQLGLLKLLPGTPLWRQAADLGYRWDPQPPYEVLAHPSLSFGEIGRFRRYAELLERLWNNGLLMNSLHWLVERSFDGRVSACFDHLLDGVAGDPLARQRAAPETLFAYVTLAWQGFLDADPVLARLFLWDYAAQQQPNRTTPDWILARLGEGEAVNTDQGRQRLPRLELCPQAAAVVNRRRPQGEELTPGAWHLWPQRHLKGRPLRILPVEH
jgi:anaerobic magnesium-protoporphyrin IX monomethyl ester cyclase